MKCVIPYIKKREELIRKWIKNKEMLKDKLICPICGSEVELRTYTVDKKCAGFDQSIEWTECDLTIKCNYCSATSDIHLSEDECPELVLNNLHKIICDKIQEKDD